MSGSSVIVTASVIAKEGQENSIGQELVALVAPTRSEPGCIFYDLYQDPENKSVFMFHEGWKDKKALEAHLQKPYIKAFMEKTQNLLAEPVKVSFWEKLPQEQHKEEIYKTK